jgi:hypothetical protein
VITGLRIFGLLAALTLWSCSEKPRSETERLELPDWRVCADSYGGDMDAHFEARQRGQEFAILCALTIDDGRNLPRADLKNLYRIYRIRGREPERLDALVRQFDRSEVWAMLLNTHYFSGELDPVESDYWGCPDFDPIARELLLRAEPGENMDCVPRRWLFWG